MVLLPLFVQYEFIVLYNSYLLKQSGREDGRYKLTEEGRQSMEFPFGVPFRRVHSIREMPTYMSGFVSYIEDLNRSDKAKVAPCRISGALVRADETVFAN